MKVTKLYDWQEEIASFEGDITIRGGRQSGKSWAVAEQIKRRALKYPNSTHLILAASERQENYLLDKFKALMGDDYKYVGRATLTRLKLRNGTTIFKFPVGMSGIYVEGLSSVDFIYVDEAIHMGVKVWDSIIPMMVEPKKRGFGWMTLLSATMGKPRGFFYESFSLDRFKKVHIKTADCPHTDGEFLESEKKRLGAKRFSVVYEGEFDEEAYLYFPREIIERAVKFKFWSLKRDYDPKLKYFLGIDPARFGKSEAGFVIAEQNGERVKIVHFEAIKKSSLLDLVKITKKWHQLFKFTRIYIDDGGFGAGLIDILVDEFKRLIRPMNNKSKGSENKTLKEDLYSNLLRLFETEKIEIVNEKKLIEDICKVEFDEEGKIIGTDLSEALSRACWCTKEKNLKPFVSSF